MATARLYPTNAPRGGSTTLTGAGNAADIFTFSGPVTVVVQNNTAATIYVASGAGVAATSAATQGDEAVPAGAEFISNAPSAWVAIYGVATTKVNGTTAGHIVCYGLQ